VNTDRGRERQIRVAIAGVGNCASSLVQGVAHYRSQPSASGLIAHRIGPFAVGDITFSTAFDIDIRKIGRPLSEAIFSKPNCAIQLTKERIEETTLVRLGPILDGVADHLDYYDDSERVLPAAGDPVDVVAALRGTGTEVLICYLPVGSEQGVRFYAEACLKAGVAFVNCVPVFIASNNTFAERFTRAKIPLIGDDVRSQVGATILHQRVVELLSERGYALTNTYQLNFGGNSDFLNMTDRQRLHSKKLSKTAAVTSRLPNETNKPSVHIGPSDYVQHLGDRKIAYIHAKAIGFAGAPLSMEIRLEVEDSPNSAAVVVDVIRYAALARTRGLGGPILPVSAYYMKTPPLRMGDAIARDQLSKLAAAVG
jgi:myo-inositol-1-phosphate synthase